MTEPPAWHSDLSLATAPGKIVEVAPHPMLFRLWFLWLGLGSLALLPVCDMECESSVTARI